MRSSVAAGRNRMTRRGVYTGMSRRRIIAALLTALLLLCALPAVARLSAL